MCVCMHGGGGTEGLFSGTFPLPRKGTNAQWPKKALLCGHMAATNQPFPARWPSIGMSWADSDWLNRGGVVLWNFNIHP